MYGYEKGEFVQITKYEILARVTEEDIFCIPENGQYEPSLYKRIKSPFREDNTPGCYYEIFEDKLRFIDWGDPDSIYRDCFDFVQDYYNLSFMDALTYINDYYDLGLGESEKNIKPERAKIKRKKGKSVRSKLSGSQSEIIIKTRNFKKQDKLFWKPYGITKQQLIDDGVYPVLWYKFYSSKKNKWIVIRPRDICYVYTDFEDNRVKIYRPHAPVKQAKWLTNCSENNIGNLRNLPSHTKTLIITKSYKDHRVLRNLNYDVIWFQNEGMIPSIKLLTIIAQRCDNIIIFYDNDYTGIEAAKKLTDVFNEIQKDKAKYIRLPKFLNKFGISDSSDLYKISKKRISLFLRKKILT